jgi:hypothetical protein
MGSEFQYKVFKATYDEEQSRYTDLEKRGQFYFGLQTFYLGAIAFKLDEVLKFAGRTKVPTVFFVLIGFLPLIALIFTVLGMRIRNYEGASDLDEIVDSFGAAPPTDSDFIDERLVDLAVATRRNSDVNDSVARYLTISAWLTLSAVAFHFIVFLWVSYKYAQP